MVGSLSIPGKFYRRYREVGFSDGTFVGVDLSFDLQLTDENEADVMALVENDAVSISAIDDETGAERDLGSYKFKRRMPRDGDESGLMILELAR